MNEDQAETVISLLVEIREKLSEIGSKINSSYDLGDVCSKLDSVVSKLGYIDSNTSS
jgi:hypothetical protein